MKKILEMAIKKFDNELNPIKGLKLLSEIIQLDYKIRQDNKDNIPNYLNVCEKLIKAFAKEAEKNNLDEDRLVYIAIVNQPDSGEEFNKYSKYGRHFRLRDFELLGYIELEDDYLTNVFPVLKNDWQVVDILNADTNELLFKLYRD